MNKEQIIIPEAAKTQATDIETVAINLIAESLHKGVGEILSRATAKSAGSGDFDLSTVEVIGHSMLDDCNKSIREMIGKILSTKINDEQVGKKTELEKAGFEVENKNKRAIKITTTLGIIAIVRTMLNIKYIKVCIKPFYAEFYEIMTCYPLDEFLGIDKLRFKMSLLMMEAVSYWAQEVTSFRRATEVIFKVYKVIMSHTLVKKVKDYVGDMVYKKDCEGAERMYGEMAKLDYELTKKGTLLMEIDGSMISTLEAGKDGSSYKEVKLAVIAKSDDIKRGKDGKSVVKKKAYIPNIWGVNEFRKHVFKEAVEAGCFKYEKTVIISDGAEWIRAMCREDYPDAVLILDFFHLIEHIYNYAKYKFKEDESKYRPYVEKIKGLLSESKSQEALECLAECEGKKLPEGMVNPYNYIKKNMDRIDYAEYKRQGFPIGSGMVESGNKIVNQRRCKQPGMMWRTDNAQTMITLRAKRESGRWDSDVRDLLLNAA